jgi:hypothetical protein
MLTKFDAQDFNPSWSPLLIPVCQPYMTGSNGSEKDHLSVELDPPKSTATKEISLWSLSAFPCIYALQNKNSFTLYILCIQQAFRFH